MNLAVLQGRLTRDPEGKATQSGAFVTRYTLAVDRYGKDKGADFINIIAFDKRAEFAEKYFKKGMLVLVRGRIQTGSYTNKEGQKVYTTDIVADDQEFAESKKAPEPNGAEPQKPTDEWVNVDEGLDEELPFK